MKAVQEVSTPLISKESKHWAVVIHACVLLGLPFIGLGLLGPFIIYFIKRKNDFVSSHARTVLNFWITMTIVMCCLVGYLWVNEGSGRDELTPLFILATAVVFQIVTWIFYGIAGVIQASRGLTIKYPLAIPFIRK